MTEPKRKRSLALLLLLALVGGALVLARFALADGTVPEEAPAPAQKSPTPLAPAGDARFVAPSGDDDAAGSRSAPWRTLAAALPRLKAGQTLYLREGRYRGPQDARLAPGRAGARIEVRSYPGERAVVRGLTRFEDPDFWTISDLEFTWSGGDFDDHMVKVSGGTGWVLDGLRIHGSRSRAGLLIAASPTAGPPHDYTLRNSSVYESRRASNLYLNPGLAATNGLIEHNIFFGSPTENVKIGYGGTCSDQGNPLFGAADITFRYNTLYDGWQPLTIAEPARGISVYRNIIGHSTRGALLRLDGQCGKLRQPLEVRDNLGFDATTWCEEFASPLKCDDLAGPVTFPRDPAFDTRGPDGFRPSDPVARAFGRYAEEQ